jgi:hypothetical protein
METSQSVGRSPPTPYDARLLEHRLDNKPLALVRQSSCKPARLEIDVGLVDEDQHAQDGNIEAEGSLLPVPGR